MSLPARMLCQVLGTVELVIGMWIMLAVAATPTLPRPSRIFAEVVAMSSFAAAVVLIALGLRP